MYPTRILPSPHRQRGTSRQSGREPERTPTRVERDREARTVGLSDSRNRARRESLQAVDIPKPAPTADRVMSTTRGRNDKPISARAARALSSIRIGTQEPMRFKECPPPSETEQINWEILSVLGAVKRLRRSLGGEKTRRRRGMMREITFGDFAKLASKRGLTAECLAERFANKIERASEFFHRLFQGQHASVVIPYRSVVAFFLSELQCHQASIGSHNRTCACGCNATIFDRKKWASAGCRQRAKRQKVADGKKGLSQVVDFVEARL